MPPLDLISRDGPTHDPQAVPAVVSQLRCVHAEGRLAEGQLDLLDPSLLHEHIIPQPEEHHTLVVALGGQVV